MDLPWWIDYKLTPKPNYWHNGNVWLPPDYHLELKKRIERYPLTPNLIREFSEKHIETLEWGLTLNRTYIKLSDIPWKFEIYISRHADEEEGAEGLVHECAHGIYRAGNEYQKLIQEETLRFYEGGNRFFMKTFLRRHIHPSTPPK
jgi:hypothetical protein